MKILCKVSILNIIFYTSSISMLFGICHGTLSRVDAFHCSLLFDLTSLQFLQFCVFKSYLAVWCFWKTYIHLLYIFGRFVNEFCGFRTTFSWWTELWVQTQHCLPVAFCLYWLKITLPVHIYLFCATKWHDNSNQYI